MMSSHSLSFTNWWAEVNACLFQAKQPEAVFIEVRTVADWGRRPDPKAAAETIIADRQRAARRRAVERAAKRKTVLAWRSADRQSGPMGPEALSDQARRNAGALSPM